MKILVLDDNKSLTAALKRMLEMHGHEVDCCHDAEEAVRLVHETEYDFVLVDYKMPDKNGIWFMQNANLPRQTKALLITAFVNREVIRRMFDLGACGYLIKPFDEKELIRNLEFHSR